MRFRTLALSAAAAVVVAIGACSRTENGDVVVKRPEVGTTTDTLHMPTMTTKIDTVSTPVIGTKKETLIVNKPIVGTKKTEVRVPVIQRP